MRSACARLTLADFGFDMVTMRRTDNRWSPLTKAGMRHEGRRTTAQPHTGAPDLGQELTPLRFSQPLVELLARFASSKALRSTSGPVRGKVFSYLHFCALARSRNTFAVRLALARDVLNGPRNPDRARLFDLENMRAQLDMPSGDFRAVFEAWIAAGLPGSPIAGLDLLFSDQSPETAFGTIVAARPTDPPFPTAGDVPFTIHDLARVLRDPAFAVLCKHHAWEGQDAARDALARLALVPRKTRAQAAIYWSLLPDHRAGTFWPFEKALRAAQADLPGVDFNVALDYLRYVPSDPPEQAIAAARQIAVSMAAGEVIDLSLLVWLREVIPSQSPQVALEIVRHLAKRDTSERQLLKEDLIAMLRVVPHATSDQVIELIERASKPENAGIPLAMLATWADRDLALFHAEQAERERFFGSERCSALVAAAVAHDPNISLPEGPGYLPPWHDVDYFGYAAARAVLPTGSVENVILVPFGKLGGADYVAGILAAALAERGRTVILRTDQPDWDRPDWYPEDVPAIDLSGALSGMGNSVRALFLLLRLLAPRAVWNVNSRLGFECFSTYGGRLADSHRLHAYYFCADRTPEGQETGYPVWYIADILPHLHAALVDTRSLADTLTSRYAMPPVLAGKLHTVHTPAQRPVDDPPLVAAQITSAAGRARPRILWAGRLDRQKRFDILEAVARAMPDVDFVAWGKAVLGKPPPARKLPKNLVLNPPFGSYDELPLGDCDGWLYTAAWDGLPTILIECGAMGMPIVASAVGGVPELIDDTTGWPVKDADDPEAYVAALRAMLDDPEARSRRATALQKRVRTRHSPEAFRAALDRIGLGSS